MEPSLRINGTMTISRLLGLNRLNKEPQNPPSYRREPSIIHISSLYFVFITCATILRGKGQLTRGLNASGLLCSHLMPARDIVPV